MKSLLESKAIYALRDNSCPSFIKVESLKLQRTICITGMTKTLMHTIARGNNQRSKVPSWRERDTVRFMPNLHSADATSKQIHHPEFICLLLPRHRPGLFLEFSFLKLPQTRQFAFPKRFADISQLQDGPCHQFQVFL